MKNIILLAAAMTALSGCDNKPKHYYAMCDSQDQNGWNLIDTERQDDYLVACTYQAQDRKQVYTVRCGDTGCG